MRDPDRAQIAQEHRTLAHRVKCLLVYVSILASALLGVAGLYKLFGGAQGYWEFCFRMAGPCALVGFVLALRGGYVGVAEAFLEDLDRSLFVQPNRAKQDPSCVESRSRRHSAVHSDPEVHHQIFEGTWEEVAKKASRLKAGTRVRLEVVEGAKKGRGLEKGAFPGLQVLTDTDFESDGMANLTTSNRNFSIRHRYPCLALLFGKVAKTRKSSRGSVGRSSERTDLACHCLGGSSLDRIYQATRRFSQGDSGSCKRRLTDNGCSFDEGSRGESIRTKRGT